MKNTIALAIVAGLATMSANADVIAYWNQNSNDLGGGLFGYTPSDFPMAADQGAGTWGIANFDGTTNGSGVYTQIESFSGTTLGALNGDPSGGSFSFEGDSNNGAQVVLTVDASLFESLTLDFARRGTGTGYNSVDVAYRDATGALVSVGSIDTAGTSTWVAYNFAFGSALDGVSSAEIVITFDGATSVNGNNRLDNVIISGNVIPAPGAMALLGLGGLVAVRRRR